MESSEKPAPPQPTVTELLTLVEQLKAELASQRAEMESKIARLENRLGPQEPLADTAGQARTSRRRLLKKMVAGAAGAAALGLAAGGSAQAGTGPDNLSFSGSGVGAGSNTATGTTTIQTDPNFPSAPLFRLKNGTNTNAAANSLPVGLYATATNSFAIYANTTGSGTAPTAILGSVGSGDPTGNDPFFANQFGGVVGASSTTRGVVGLSQAAVGVDGLSAGAAGVRGVSTTGVGGAFGSLSGNSNEGAALQLGIRTGTEAPPSGKSYNHSAGEIFLDRYGRIFVCQAGYQGALPAALSQDAAFPVGFTNPNGPNWGLVPTVVLKSTDPTTPDQNIHPQGELWINTQAGSIHVCTTGGTNNTTMQSAYSLPAPAFKTLSSGSGSGAGAALNVLSAPVRVIDTRVPTGTVVSSSLGGTPTGKFTGGETRVYQITDNNGPIPTGTISIMAAATGVNIDMVSGQTGYFTFWGTGARPPISQVTYNVPNVANTGFFVVGLDPVTGRLSIFSFRSAHIIIDISAYFK